MAAVKRDTPLFIPSGELAHLGKYSETTAGQCDLDEVATDTHDTFHAQPGWPRRGICTGGKSQAIVSRFDLVIEQSSPRCTVPTTESPCPVHGQLKKLLHQDVLDRLAQQAAEGGTYQWIAQNRIDGRMLLNMFKWVERMSRFFTLQAPLPPSVMDRPHRPSKTPRCTCDEVLPPNVDTLDTPVDPSREGREPSTSSDIFGIGHRPRLQGVQSWSKQPSFRTSRSSRPCELSSRLSQPFQPEMFLGQGGEVASETCSLTGLGVEAPLAKQAQGQRFISDVGQR